MKFKDLLPTIIGLVIALGSSAILRLTLNPEIENLTASAKMSVQLASKWGVAIILILLVLFWERLPLSSIGIKKPGQKDVFWAFVGFLIGGVLISGTMPLVKELGLGSTEAGVRRLAELSFGLRAAAVLTSGITEEILYRGYAVERLNFLTGRLVLSAGLAYLVFVALHLAFWGVGGTIQIGLGSLVLYGLYLWRRNLPACMLMHVLNNAVAFLIVPAFLPQTSG